MANNLESYAKLASYTNIDPNEFDITVGTLLIGLGAEKYVDIFRKNNIGQSTLLELTDEDLVKLGVDDADIRLTLLDQVKNLPIYDDSIVESLKVKSDLSLIDIGHIIDESSQHLHRIYLSMLANTLAIKKTKKNNDCIIHNDVYASDIAIEALNEISNILNSMEISLRTQMEVLTRTNSKSVKKKIVVGSMGGAAICILTILFIRSLKQIV